MKENNFIAGIERNIKLIDNRQINEAVSLIKNVKKKKLFCWKWSSAAISSHLAIDFTKAAGLRAVNFNESSLLTCFSNDFGYENWIKELQYYSLPGDIVILVSSSGKSKNIVNAAKFLKIKKIN